MVACRLRASSDAARCDEPARAAWTARAIAMPIVAMNNTAPRSPGRAVRRPDEVGMPARNMRAATKGGRAGGGTETVRPESKKTGEAPASYTLHPTPHTLEVPRSPSLELYV